jgi:transcriptional regulator with XRE-family HTH domain
MESVSDKLADYINRELNARQWSVRELARRSGLAHTTINDVTALRSNPGLEFCRSIARAFNVPPEQVLRLAGLLPPVPEETVTIAELVFLANQLPLDEQEKLVQIAKAWAGAREEETNDVSPQTRPAVAGAG